MTDGAFVLIGLALLAAFALGARWGIRVAVRRIEADRSAPLVYPTRALTQRFITDSIIWLNTGATDEKPTLH